MSKYETIIVGGGPAGLSGAIHLAWHDRKVLVIDRKTGPLFFTLEKLYNVPGMPATRGVELQKKLKEQAENLGAAVIRGNVVSAHGQEGEFLLQGEKGEEWLGQTILLATGIARYHPTVDGDYRPCFAYAGKGNMFYCPDCEAPEIRDKDTIVIGSGSADGAAGMAIGLSRYTNKMRVLLTESRDLSQKRAEQLQSRGIQVVEGKIQNLIGKKGILSGLELEDGTQLTADAFFVSSPVRGRTDLAQQLGVEMAKTGNHAQPKSQRGDTNVPGVWIAGDLRPMTQQVSVAMGTGNIAAIMIDQTLRKQEVLSSR
ncbi:NAD(P)/FAD-dependent oxidoreductase [candidate division KSB1 bacterium]|nr:NAD(P)/FAD-dependent oxidoreductase [candidate division KSB1 bacterium]NIR72724.1 NAD(P)/FAD-dependent oxidoreductase [candidate division KSB1 bacterium]NIS26809.1 NAD(P)/FAD-dependent oxidoreductase [candidate division KSB1 bacterium]NIT73603.1 NAD(P)/FAD-dependent oxidoreductase [candidate division KSB1 bacterium]NIU27479.1 NAD(P)/FAD-dependent oxidoreductase [candidate division KSB1 bacterium]